jgi:integrating conjugative element protein (TIGR03746 family)
MNYENADSVDDEILLEGDTNDESVPLTDRLGQLPKKMVSKMAELAEHVFTLRMALVMMFVVCLLSFWQNYRINQNITVHIPPDISNGVIMKEGEIPRANILVYASYLWVEFNSWTENGEKDAYDNLIVFEHYFGDQFLKDMKGYYDKLKSDGDLVRTRRLTFAEGALLDVTNRVKPITEGSWVVYLDMLDEERFDGKLVKSSRIRYPLIVERTETTIDKNPIGVRIVGFAEEPTLLNEY